MSDTEDKAAGGASDLATTASPPSSTAHDAQSGDRPSADLPPAPDQQVQESQPSPEVRRIADIRTSLANIRAQAVHGQNGDHRALAAGVIALTELLDGLFGG